MIFRVLSSGIAAPKVLFIFALEPKEAECEL